MNTRNEETIESLIEYCQDAGRICPMPIKWNELYQMLPGHERGGHGNEPYFPLILAAWDSPALFKQIRLQEHIRWAATHSVLADISVFLRSLSEDEWHHFNN